MLQVSEIRGIWTVTDGFYYSKDPFIRREAAYEAVYIHSQEAEKLKALQSKMKEQRRHLDELEEHM